VRGPGLEVAPNHPLQRILHELANPEMSAAELRETLMGHVLLWGNAYAEVQRDSTGRIIALWPLRPDRMRVERGADGVLRYLYQLPTGERVVLRGPTARERSQVLHVRGLSFDGRVGYSPIAVAREAVALHLAAQEFGARFFSNQGQPLGALQVPKGTSAKAIQHLRESWRELHTGLSRAHRVAILEEGITWQSIGIPPEDAQFLQSREFQTVEIARIFGVPPPLIGVVERVGVTGQIEQLAIQFAKFTVTPWAVRIEQAVKRDLFTLADWQRFEVRFTLAGLLRGDIKSRYEAYATGRQWGWLSADDIRILEDMNPLPGGIGQSYLQPLNMVALRDGEQVAIPKAVLEALLRVSDTGRPQGEASVS
jgi:HK97 family phage portal protein